MYKLYSSSNRVLLASTQVLKGLCTKQTTSGAGETPALTVVEVLRGMWLLERRYNNGVNKYQSAQGAGGNISTPSTKTPAEYVVSCLLRQDSCHHNNNVSLP